MIESKLMEGKEHQGLVDVPWKEDKKRPLYISRSFIKSPLQSTYVLKIKFLVGINDTLPKKQNEIFSRLTGAIVLLGRLTPRD